MADEFGTPDSPVISPSQIPFPPENGGKGWGAEMGNNPNIARKVSPPERRGMKLEK